ncbi:MAG TPA: hypothetical protein VIM11_17545 [Tepidisphaeraceae bacterium]|jgi:hypothetical protein
MSRTYPKAKRLLQIVAGTRAAVGTIDSATGTITFSHGPPKMPRLSETGAKRRHVAADFLAMLKGGKR